MLPDDILLEIFDFYVDVDLGDEDFAAFEKEITEVWITLAHVCRRWRSVVFQSPSRLNLRFLCTPKTPARDILDIWPPLPLIIRVQAEPSRVENITAALGYNERVCQIDLIDLTSPQWEYVMDSGAAYKPFPVLTHLRLNTYDRPGPILPDSFLGKTAPRLRSLDLVNITFPGLPKLLLSSTHLVVLDLFDIPRSGYIPPEAMATTLPALTSLKFLRLHFRYPRPRPALESRRPCPPPLSRSILPGLTVFLFKGVSEYLEEILARIDAPRLEELHITFFNQIIFDTPQLFLFISRRPTLRALEVGYIEFGSGAIIVKFPSQASDRGVLSVEIACTASEWQLSSLEQVCTSSLPTISALEDLHIFENREYPPHWQDDVENRLWLDLLRSFVAVKHLYLSEGFVPRIAPALQELVGGRTMEVLPTLENISLEGLPPSRPLHEGIEKFVAARRLTSHPVEVFCSSEKATWRSRIGNYPSVSVSLTFLAISLPPPLSFLLSFALVFLNIMIPMMNTRRLFMRGWIDMTQLLIWH